MGAHQPGGPPVFAGCGMEPSQKIPGGYVHLVRDVIHSSLWTMPANAVKLGLTCVAMANWQDRKWWDGKEEVVIRRGSFVTSIRNLAKSAQMPPSEIQRCLRSLSHHGLISTKASSRWTLITVIKYDYYNDPKSYVNKEDTGGIGTPTGTVTGTPIGTEAGTMTGTLAGNNLRSKAFEEYKQERKEEQIASTRQGKEPVPRYQPDPRYDPVAALYPGVCDHAEAKVAWERIKPTEVDVTEIKAMLGDRKRWPSIWKEKTEAIPYLSNFLLRRIWHIKVPLRKGFMS